MKSAIIATGGKQYRVAENQIIEIEKLPEENGSTVSFDTLMVFDEEGAVEIGAPSLGEKVSAEVLDTAKGDKISVIKFKNKTRYRRNVGHRQIRTKVKINKIG